MCIFCGGACGGIGDMLLPTLATGAGLVMFKIKAQRESRKIHDQDKFIEDESEITKCFKKKSNIKQKISNIRLNNK
jgi:hypothetical protein